MRAFRRWMRLLGLLQLCGACIWLHAQTGTSQLMGTVTDATGAAVPGAELTATQVNTGVATRTASNALGFYTFPRLQPGIYEVRATKDGFKTLIRSGVTLIVSQTTTANVELQLGAVTQDVTVKAEAALLETSEAAMGGSVEQHQIANMPLNGRDAYQLAALLPGVQPQAGFFTSRVFQETSFESNFTVNGSPSFSNDVLVDGTPNIVSYHGQMAWTPPQDAVQEFRALTSTYSSEYGRTGGGFVSIATKSGTNQFHGDVFESVRNTVLDANDFFDNRDGVSRQPLIYNMYGGSFGGPVHRDHTFFFFAYEGQKANEAQTMLSTVPTAAQRTGDFSRTFTAAGQLITIYNPFATQGSSASGYTRPAFPGNQIPASMLNPAAQNITTYYPNPNLPGQGPSGINNFTSAAPAIYGFNTYDGRVDQYINDKNRLLVRWSWDSQTATPPNFFHNLATSGSMGPSTQPDYNAAISYTHTFNPNTLLNLRYGFAFNGFNRQSESNGMDVTTLGFPASFNNSLQIRQFPYFTTTGIAALGAKNNAYYQLASAVHEAAVQVMRTQGRHNLAMGFEFRNYLMNVSGDAGPTFNFSPSFTQGPNPLVSTATGGYGFASYLLGTATSGSVGFNAGSTFGWHYYAGYIQDDFRVSRKLTLNLGLRYGYQAPRTDRFNAQSWFDPNVPNPIGSQVRLPGLRGGLEFAGVNGNPRGLGLPQYFDFEPRIGFAYQLASKTVVRGGYGMVYLPINADSGAYGSQNGFATSTSMLATVDSVTPVDLLNNPYPQGLVQPTGSSQGLATFLGQTITDWNRSSVGYVENFNLNMQRELPGGVLVEAGYVGTHGVNIPTDFSYDQLPDQYLSLGNALLNLVPNPFYGYVQSGTYSAKTIQQGYLLRPFPQFAGVTATRLQGGYSDYNSFQLRVEKRFQDFSIVGAYTNGKLIGDDVGSDQAFVGDLSSSIQDYNNRRLERSLSPEDVSQRLVINYVYDLPFGPGRHWLNGSRGAIAGLAGGWRLAGITTFQTGFPLIFATATNNTHSYGGGSRPNNNGTSAELPAGQRTVDDWFNTAVFSLPAPYTFGTEGRTDPTTRSDGIRNFDFSIIKTTKVTERFEVEFHADSFNLFNRPQFGIPNTTLGATQFGVITAQANNPRELQLGLKLSF